MNRLREKFNKEITKELLADLKVANVMQLPKLQKITLNAGIGNFRDNKESVATFADELARLAGQKPSPRRARLSEAGFKIRQGNIVGYAVTLRGERMWSFLDKLINIALPQVRDFKGLGLNSFDERGNYSVGILEHVIFPEVDANSVKGIRSMQLTFTITSNGKEESRALLTKLGMPFKKSKKENKA